MLHCFARQDGSNWWIKKHIQMLIHSVLVHFALATLAGALLDPCTPQYPFASSTQTNRVPWLELGGALSSGHTMSHLFNASSFVKSCVKYSTHLDPSSVCTRG